MYLLKGQFTVKGSDLPLIQGFTVSFKTIYGVTAMCQVP